MINIVTKHNQEFQQYQFRREHAQQHQANRQTQITAEHALGARTERLSKEKGRIQRRKLRNQVVYKI